MKVLISILGICRFVPDAMIAIHATRRMRRARPATSAPRHFGNYSESTMCTSNNATVIFGFVPRHVLFIVFYTVGTTDRVYMCNASLLNNFDVFIEVLFRSKSVNLIYFVSLDT
jgi:hypothetical protein